MGCQPWNLHGWGRSASASQEVSDVWFSSPVPFTHGHSHGLTRDFCGCACVLSCTGTVPDICRCGQHQDRASGLFSLLQNSLLLALLAFVLPFFFFEGGWTFLLAREVRMWLLAGSQAESELPVPVSRAITSLHSTHSSCFLFLLRL